MKESGALGSGVKRNLYGVVEPKWSRRREEQPEDTGAEVRGTVSNEQGTGLKREVRLI